MSRYEERLMDFARQGRTTGFRIPLWKGQAEKLERDGVILTNPLPTERKGRFSYEVDFSLPLPGTFAARLNKVAQENGYQKSDNSAEPEPLHHPYELP